MCAVYRSSQNTTFTGVSTVIRQNLWMVIGHPGRGTIAQVGPGITNNLNLDARIFCERNPIVVTDKASCAAAEAEWIETLDPLAYECDSATVVAHDSNATPGFWDGYCEVPLRGRFLQKKKRPQPKKPARRKESKILPSSRSVRCKTKAQQDHVETDFTTVVSYFK